MTLIKNEDGTFAVTGLTEKEVGGICASITMALTKGNRMIASMVLIAFDIMASPNSDMSPEEKSELIKQFEHLIEKRDMPEARLCLLLRQQMIVPRE